jgi:prevent-host-death family protein
MGKTVAATEFKAKCLALIDEMQRTGVPLTVTRRGKPSITLVADAERPGIANIFGLMKGRMKIVGDIEAPLDPEWEAEWDHNNPASLYNSEPR